jgi:ubiquitin C-terminal hydrolase
LLTDEFNNLQKSSNKIKDYNKNIPYQILISETFPDSDKKCQKFIINEGVFDNLHILSQLNIQSSNDKISNLVEYLLNNRLFITVKFNKSSRFMKSFSSLNNCITGICKPLEGEEYETYTEEMEVEEESEENDENKYYSGRYITLDHCLQYFTEEECLEEGNEWYCNKCRKRVMASKQIELFYLPRILCICLTRFLKQGRYYGYSKNTKLVEFPLENLNMAKYYARKYLEVLSK